MPSIYLRHLKLHQFRNLADASLDFGEGITVLWGHNGQGKTNILEAISLLASFRTFRSLKTTMDLIQFGLDEGMCSGSFKRGEVDTNVRMEIRDGKKSNFIDNKPVRDRQKIHEKIALVTFVPDDLNIVSGSGSNRRKLLNQLCYNLYPTYATLYRKYERALGQRNQLLKQYPIPKSELDAFTEILVQLGEDINEHRRRALDVWQPLFQASLASITDGLLDVAIDYPAVDLAEQFSRRRDEEIARKTTILGPHLDDLEVRMNTELARYSASRGQCRAIVLAMKLAQIEAIRRLREMNPILLLDDVVGELDHHFAKHLLDHIHRCETQTFITTTHLDLIPMKADRSFEISCGKIL